MDSFAVCVMVMDDPRDTSAAVKHAVYFCLTLFVSFADDPKVPLHIGMWAVQTAVTTMTCVSDFLDWENFSSDQKRGLLQYYGPYVALGKCRFFGSLNVQSRCVTISDCCEAHDLVDMRS
jgi:hypothetical protein